MPVDEKKVQYINKYNREKCKTFCVRFSYAHNGDVIDYLTKNGVQPTILKAVKKMMKEEAGE